MKIIGIGIDILRINRIKKIFNLYKENFLKKILSKKEFFFYNQSIRKIKFLTRSFVIKEATCKALGTGIQNKISFKNIEIYYNQKKQLRINYLKHALYKKNKLGINKSHISFTDEKKYAQAIVILES
ncbi:holo-ACP synthase [Buchnera aphidicola]|uniref:holo-ACP synthase n=1 Tax=Buchnera aphidicola TaxID=9 RepID=UPI002237D227|nr:holo-ACP synthase [Buchnera aphidicola]MCW5197672.1 holo-ACP synthase [Buchnera aphidicola (Chaitophorus viminalis)]